MRWFFGFFFVSGFCSVLYEIVWLRLAMAQFGVTSALVSIVLSMFMAGLGLGSWWSGRLIRKYGERGNLPGLRLYAVAELLIGLSAILVPRELLAGRRLLELAGFSSSWSYYFASGIWIGLTLVPGCACMGATIPVAMLAIRTRFHNEAQRSFSFLYLANVLGAVAGATMPLLLIERYGFHGALRISSGLNVLLGLSAAGLSLRWPANPAASVSDQVPTAALRPIQRGNPLALLFTTGLTSMGMEVVWIRQFTPYLSTVVYAFASILGLYLLATFAGSQIYRRWSRSHAQESRLVWACLGLCALLPLVTANPQYHLSKLLRLVIGIAPFSGLLGFVTPMLVDRRSGGDPNLAGSAYAVNVAGCILGPLLAGFVLLPLLSEKWVLFVLALPWLFVAVSLAWSSSPGSSSHGGEVKKDPAWLTGLSYALALLALGIVFTGRGYEGQFVHRRVLRDHTATVVATGEGLEKKLLINGYGITRLTPSTKLMAHLPLAFLDHSPRNALVVCFGMGTTYRSLLSWNIPVTAVELVPSVPRLFGYYHEDGPTLLTSPLSRVVIDDGRRYLERTPGQYDVITIDPPPPVEAAGSSMLYSKEFYSIISRRLQPGGILQQWLPYGDAVVQTAVARALQESFPYVRVFHSVRGSGFHFLASGQPLPESSATHLLHRMPASAIADLMEWGPEPSAERQLGAVLDHEIRPDQMTAESPRTSALRDDLPVNEYYVLRRRVIPVLRRYLARLS